mmetsp:Transcript_47851/g.108585  ORF Transcript_47851/g.108585 Transcript_47851/m.108585 type:complete len:490 (+) Transcript_47851:99-1568(+)
MRATRLSLVLAGLAGTSAYQLSMRAPGVPKSKRARLSKALRHVPGSRPLFRLLNAPVVDCDKTPDECDWECADELAAADDCEIVQKPRAKDRLIVRIDDRWVDLTGWRNAHPAGSHWIDVYNKADATEVMHAFHSEEAHAMLNRLPPAKEADIPQGVPEVTAHTKAFRALREKLKADGWFKRNPLMEAFTLGGWAAIVASAVLAAAKGNLVLSTVLLGCSNTVAGWVAHDYIHGRGKWPSLMRGFGELGGGMSSTWWSDKHNMHHALTNVVGIDEDLMVDPALYLWAPNKENDNPIVRKIQHWYWPIPYSLLFAIWRIDSIKVTFQRKLWGEFGRLGLHYAALGLLFPWQVLLPAVFLSGLLTATIVTVSHVSEDLYFDGPHKVDYVESQFRSTRDFVCSNPLFEYLSGGMNYQVEHHLFPTMPRYKYPALVPILKDFAAKNNLTYRVDGDFAILKRTVGMLKKVSKLPQTPEGPPSRSDQWVTPAAAR